MNPPHDELVPANGIDLCVEAFGDTADPAILLIGGATASMDWWEDELCELLAAGSRFVIRYDHRDTGRSVSYEPGAPQYTFRDLVADAGGRARYLPPSHRPSRGDIDGRGDRSSGGDRPS
jgi:pimeloyl-ACP methyl ester carboxylesterase